MLCADLLGKQTADPVRQRHIALGTKGVPQVHRPGLVLRFPVGVDLQFDGLLQALDRQLADLEIVLCIGLQHLAAVHRVVAQQVGLVGRAVADVVDRLHHLDVVELAQQHALQLVAAAAVDGTCTQVHQLLFELAGGGQLTCSEGALDRNLVVRVADRKVVPGLLRDFVALVVQRLGHTVGNLLQYG